MNPKALIERLNLKFEDSLKSPLNPKSKEGRMKIKSPRTKLQSPNLSPRGHHLWHGRAQWHGRATQHGQAITIFRPPGRAGPLVHGRAS